MTKNNEIDRQNRWSRATVLAAAAALSAGCSSGGGVHDPEEFGLVRLQLTAPPGVGCVRLEFAGARTVTKDVLTSGEVSTKLRGLPTGSVAIASFAYGGACGASEPLW